MILSHAHRFAFVHIPKCAGSSLKMKLEAIDDTGGMFRKIRDHPEMGMVHFDHLTLDDLATHYPGHYADLLGYASVAIVRHPTERFVSAVHQRLREFKDFAQSSITARVLNQEVDEIIGYLDSRAARLELEYIHFNRQSDYVFREDRQVVKHLFRFDEIHRAAAYIHDVTGVEIDANQRENVTTALRFATLLPMVRVLRQPYVKLVPHATREKVRSGLSRLGLYTNPALGSSNALSAAAEDFLSRYYSRDYALFESLAPA